MNHPLNARLDTPWLARGLSGRLLRRALLRGLRPARLPHAPPLDDETGLAAHGLRRLTLQGQRGQRLALWLALPEAAAPAPVVLALHGWGANASTLWPVVAPLRQRGIAVALLDASCHGHSGDERHTSLPRFAQDLATAVQALRGEPGVDAARIALLGHSVGAAACLLHAARDTDVAAVVSLAAFAHPREVMLRWLDEVRLPRRVVGEAILAVVQQVIGTRFDAIAPLHHVGRLRCPLLLVHGRQDRTVPVADALRLQQACAGAQLLLVDGGHDLRDALPPHEAALLGFLARHLGVEAAA